MQVLIPLSMSTRATLGMGRMPCSLVSLPESWAVPGGRRVPCYRLLTPTQPHATQTCSPLFIRWFISFDCTAQLCNDKAIQSPPGPSLITIRITSCSGCTCPPSVCQKPACLRPESSGTLSLTYPTGMVPALAHPSFYVAIVAFLAANSGMEYFKQTG